MPASAGREAASIVPELTSSEPGRTIEYSLQHLSPLDAFKARGQFLHAQLRRNGNEQQRSRPLREQRERASSSDPFSLDSTLHSRQETRRSATAEKELDLTAENEQTSARTRNERLDDGTGYYDTSALAKSLSSNLNHSSVQTSQSSKQQFYTNGSLSTDHRESKHISSRKNIAKVQNPAAVADYQKSSSLTSSPTRSVRSFASETNSHSEDPVSPSTYSIGTARVRGEESPSSLRAPNHQSERQELTHPSPKASHPKRTNSHGYPALETDPWRQSAQRSPLNSPRSQPRSNQQRSTSSSSRVLSYDNSPHAPNSSNHPRRPSSKTSGVSRQESISNTRIASLPDAALSAATHIELGIEQHEDNQLPQSTHHFKVAADMGEPTGCLMYGLALRHGWGVRPDLNKSIVMLQKAVESLNPNAANLRTSKVLDVVRADDLSIAIYEIGMSYKNGWGVTSDKKLSLKYFELACDWGDVEAMIEAADCYLQGIGCKKDKARAATLLREAEVKGRKEIGNSWIWKSKYD